MVGPFFEIHVFLHNRVTLDGRPPHGVAESVILIDIQMKNKRICPKCSSTDILRIPGQAGAYGSGNNIPVGWTIYSAVKVTRFLCAGCGFSEEWVESMDDVEKLRDKHYPA